ncbi:phage tail tape measure protein [Morganella morganii subsp. morganii]|uniref:phage tail tape measure protein n=1 Tax=Morganella morganii TaxID=582 RepID=UPI0015F3F937|nr:phage tail tape measure protein [Morganella morganii]MBA5820767.1 phage tail tape measure protein [Morganella morganii]MBT0357958.1 phage tail tape measure protein [Morganella morganii subsp. morganii]
MADVASLAVALHLNAASFKSDVEDAYNSASASSKKFTQNIGRESAKTAEQISQVSTEAQRAGNSIARMSNTGAKGGFAHLRTSLTNISSGANVAGSSILSAFIPALERAANDVDRLKMSMGEKRQMDIAAANDAVKVAESHIKQANSAKEAAMQQMKMGHKMRESARYQRELAMVQNAHMEKMREVNLANGMSADAIDKQYSKERAINDRKIANANALAEKARDRLRSGSAALAAAEADEALGKQKLTAATTQLAGASKELTFAQRASAQAGGLLKNTWAMLGGTLGIGLMAAAGAATYLYSQYKEAEERQKAFNAAIQKGGAGLNNSVYQLRTLANQLGGTAEAYKTVTAAATAGFSGSMLREVSEFGVQLEKSGGSADLLITKLSSINEQPLQSLRQLINEGLVFDEATINRIALLERQGKLEEAKEVARNGALNASRELNRQQQEANERHAESVSEIDKRYQFLNNTLRDYSNTAATAHMVSYHMMNMEKLTLQAAELITADRREQQQKEQIKNTREQLDAQLQLNSAYKAGADKHAEKLKLQNAAREQLKSGQMDAKQFEQTMKGIDSLYSSLDKKGHGGSGIPEGQRRAQQLMEQTATLRAQLAENEKLTASESKLIAFEQELVGLAGKKLNAAQKSVVENAGSIRTQLQLNAGLEREIALKGLRKKFDDQNFEIAQRTQAMQQEADNQRLQLMMPTADYDLMLEEQRIADDFRQRRYQLDKEISDKTSQLYKDQTAVLNAEQQKQTDIVRQAAKDKAASEADWQGGLKQGWKDFSDSSGNAFAMMRNASANALNSTSSMFTDFLTTGRANFADFTKSILTDITKMIVQMTIFNALKSGLSGTWLGDAMGMAPNATGGVYTSPGLSAYSNSIVSSPTVFPFAKGGAPNIGLMGEAGSEAIMPLKRGPDGNLGVRAYGGSSAGGTAPVVNIHIDSDGNQQVQASGGLERFGRDIGQYVDQRYRALMDRDTRPGGAVWNLAKGGR